MSTINCSLLSLGCAFGFAAPADKQLLTALRALKIAQRRLRPEVRSKLLSASSSRTDPALVPEAWRFVFLDPGTSGHCRIVTVAAKTSSEHPDTVEAFAASRLESTSGAPPIPQTKLLVDSHQALEKVRVNWKLKGVSGAEYQLSQQRGQKEPMWTIQFHGENGEPVGRFQVGAKSGAFEQVAIER